MVESNAPEPNWNSDHRRDSYSSTYASVAAAALLCPGSVLLSHPSPPSCPLAAVGDGVSVSEAALAEAAATTTAAAAGTATVAGAAAGFPLPLCLSGRTD